MAIQFLNNVAVDTSVLFVDTVNNLVGIGVTNPSSFFNQARNLVVGGSGNTGVTVYSSSSGNTFLAFADVADAANSGFNAGGSFYYEHANDAMVTRVNGAERMRINSSGNVGIGTTSPGHLLEIRGTGDALSVGNDTNTLTYMRFANERTMIGYSGANAVVQGGLSKGIRFNVNNNTFNSGNAMAIDTSGNVGIGTTSPNKKLEVSGSSAPTIRIDNTKSGSWTVGEEFGGLEFYGNDASGEGPGLKGYVKLDSTNIFGAAFDMRFGTTDGTNGITERMVINHAGKVGIGTTSPGHLLEVRGTADALSVGDDSNTNTYARFANDRTYFGYLSSGNAFMQGGNTKGISFHTGSSTLGANERMRITSSGNVGIGTTSPSHKLDVDGYIAADRYVDNDNASFYLEPGSGTTGQWKFQTPSGYVSIGPNNSSYSHFYTDRGQYYFNKKIVVDSGVIASYNEDLTFQAPTNSTRMVIDSSSGNVGIGTTSPDFKLQIATPALQTGSTYSWPFDITRENSTTRGLSIGVGAAGGTSVIGNHNADLAFGHTFGTDSNGLPQFYETMRIKHIDQAVGNVGIGTTSPAHKLDVQGRIRLKSVNHQIIFNDTDSGVDEWSITTYSNTGLAFYDGAQSGSSVMTLLSGGNVGIGTNSPSFQLELSTNSAGKPTSSAWTIVSDERVKTNIRTYETGLQELLQIKPKVFDYNGKAGFDTEAKNNIGVIAQEIKDIMPETVKKYNAKLNEEDKEDTELYNFDTHALTFVLINSVKELNAKIENLEEKIQTLQNK